MTGTKKSTASSKWGYGWGLGKKEKEVEAMRERTESDATNTPLPVYEASGSPKHQPPVRRDTKSSYASASSGRTQASSQQQQPLSP